MKGLFPGYNKPTNEEFYELWRNCVFAFDANMLLNIYRYTPETQESFFLILDKLKDRIWIPHQAATEYYKNRDSVIEKQYASYKEIVKIINEFEQALDSNLRVYKKHPSVDIDQVIKPIISGIKKARRVLEKNRKNHPDLSILDPLRDRIEEFFNNKVGPQFDDKRLLEIYVEADQRYKLEKPPGFKDSAKPGPSKYGDVVVWFQLIEHAKKEKRSLIFVTDDRKDDWWLRREGKTISPRPELIDEIHSKAKIGFYMYQSDQFMEYAQKFLHIESQEAAVQEIKEIRAQDENRQTAYEALTANYQHFRPQDATLYAANRGWGIIDKSETEAIKRAAEAVGAFPDSLMLQRARDFVALTGLGYGDPSAERRAQELIYATRDLRKDAYSIAHETVLDSIRKRHLPRFPVHLDVDVVINPKHAIELEIETFDDPQIEVLLNKESEELELELVGYEENLEDIIKSPPYELNNFPLAISITDKRNPSHPHKTLHRLRKPTRLEWEEWATNIEYSRRYLSQKEIDDQISTEEHEEIKEVFQSSYSEFEANEKFYNKLILEIAGARLDKDDNFPLDKFRQLPFEVINKLRYAIKNRVITKFYECYCNLKTEGANREERLVRQEIFQDETSFEIDHVLRSATEEESKEFRFNIIKGHFSKNEEGEEIIQLGLNLSAAVKLYDALILRVENALVDGKTFLEKEKESFLEEINPVYKLRVLEALLNLKAWYFEIDNITF